MCQEASRRAYRLLATSHRHGDLAALELGTIPWNDSLGYLTRFVDHGDGRLVPAGRGHYDRTYAELVQDLGSSSDIGGALDVYSLRGHAQPLDKLVPKVLEVCEGTDHAMVILDPIYKVITGDENSATDMALFVAQLDVIADRLGCSVVYAHHHSKGKQGWKYSLDRMSGSGVFARDPDAILDMSPLVVNGDEGEQLAQSVLAKRLVCAAMDEMGVDEAPRQGGPLRASR